MAQALVHRAREASIRLAEILDKDRPSASQTSKPALSLIGAFALLCVVALPYTPQVVAFERAPQPSAGHYEYSAKAAKPAAMVSSFVQPIVQRASYVAAPITHELRFHHKKAAIQTNATSKFKVENLMASTQSPKAAPQGSSIQMSRETSIATEERTPLPTNVVANDQMQFLRPTLVFFQAQYVESDSDQNSDSQPHYTIWRVQVWRLTVFTPTWKNAPQIPVAHST